MTALVAIRAERPLALWPAVVSTFREADLLPVVRCDAAEGVMPAS